MASGTTAVRPNPDKLKAESRIPLAGQPGSIDTSGPKMKSNKMAVRQILDKVKAEGRTSLTAPEGKLVCDAYG